jgi:hypothetical protein
VKAYREPNGNNTVVFTHDLEDTYYIRMPRSAWYPVPVHTSVIPFYERCPREYTMLTKKAVYECTT